MEKIKKSPKPKASVKKSAPETPKWKPAAESIVETFTKAVSSMPPSVDRKKMFGYPCVFVNGQMFSGLHQDGMVLRLSTADRTEFMTIEGAKPFEPMPGRVMKEYAVVPPQILGDEKKLGEWLKRSLEFASSLPPKTKAKK